MEEVERRNRRLKLEDKKFSHDDIDERLRKAMEGRQNVIQRLLQQKREMGNQREIPNPRQIRRE